MGINIAVHKRVVTKLTRKFCLTIWFYRNRSSQLDNVSTEFFVLQRSQSPQRKTTQSSSASLTCELKKTIFKIIS